MGRERPERKAVEELLKASTKHKAHEIAAEIGLVDTMGYDQAVKYVQRVKRSLREKGELATPAGRFASDKERLEDITRLFELRQGKMSQKAAHTMLMLNCYLRLRSDDDNVHMAAFDDTYDKNKALEEPFTLAQAVSICGIALAQYEMSINDERDKEAKKRGYPGAGLNYTNDSLIRKLEITDDEMQYMKSIRPEGEYNHEG